VRAPEQDWAVVVPVKGGPLAKSRLHLPRDARAALADAFARDTVDALAAGMPGAAVLVVTPDAEVARWVTGAGHAVVADPGSGLDSAVAAGVGAASGFASLACTSGAPGSAGAVGAAGAFSWARTNGANPKPNTRSNRTKYLG